MHEFYCRISISPFISYWLQNNYHQNINTRASVVPPLDSSDTLILRTVYTEVFNLTVQ